MICSKTALFVLDIQAMTLDARPFFNMALVTRRPYQGGARQRSYFAEIDYTNFIGAIISPEFCLAMSVRADETWKEEHAVSAGDIAGWFEA